jgi:hypothetical protein
MNRIALPRLCHFATKEGLADTFSINVIGYAKKDRKHFSSFKRRLHFGGANI